MDISSQSASRAGEQRSLRGAERVALRIFRDVTRQVRARVQRRRSRNGPPIRSAAVALTVR